ncbi:MAG: hypothetical protein Q8898_01790 [Bacillota bacterium]|nr:hypothetical protein [Bacillota bacterium]
MKYIIYRSKHSTGKNHLELVGDMHASSLDVASDIVYRELRKKVKRENGQAYYIIPYNEKMKIPKEKITSLNGMPFRVVQYRNINEEI